MAALTEKDLEQKRAKVDKLREQIADAESKAAAATQEQNLAIEAAGLDAEAARLESRLAAAKEAAKVSNVRDGAAGPLAAATEQLEVAQAGTTPVGMTVDAPADAPTEASEANNQNGGN